MCLTNRSLMLPCREEMHVLEDLHQFYSATINELPSDVAAIRL